MATATEWDPARTVRNYAREGSMGMLNSGACKLLLRRKNGQYKEIAMSAQDAIDVFRRNAREVQGCGNLEVPARGEGTGDAYR